MNPDHVLSQLQVYLAMAWPLFPCRPRPSGKVKADGTPRTDEKSPLTDRGFYDASLSPDQIRSWAEQHPGCAWGTPTSADRGVVEYDIRHCGDAIWSALLAEHGPLPPTPTCRSGGGGQHFYLRFPPGTRSGEVRGLSVGRKAEGGYVIVPPSRIDIPEHGGRAYTWEVRPWEVPVADAPEWLFRPTSPPAGKAPPPIPADPWVVRSGDEDLVSHPGSPEGERRRTLCSLLGRHLSRGDSPGTLFALAEGWAARCSPPFEEWEKHAQGLLRKEFRKVGATPLGLDLLRYSEVTITEDPTPGLSVATDRTNEEGPSAGGDTSFVRSPDAGPLAEAAGEPGWPVLHEDALYGLAGEIVRAVAPETEADPAGVLLGLLTCFGSAVGRGAWFAVGPERHGTNLFCCVVGDTAAAKGQAWGLARSLMARAAPGWAERCIGYGLSSGEGLIERVRDAAEGAEPVVGKDGVMTGFRAVVAEPAAEDKRLLCYEAEFAKLFSTKGREGNTLGANLRAAWDGTTLEALNRRQNALRSTGHHVSILGNVTPDELADCLKKGTDTVNGFVNRFLWVMVRRSRLLPKGGDAGVLDRFAGPLADALAFAQGAGACRRTEAAERLWVCVYPALAEGRSGSWGKATERARPQVMRLALIYALLDGRAEIDTPHLKAALAVWGYCERSALRLFGTATPTATAAAALDGGPLTERVLGIIEARPGGCSRTDLHDGTNRNVRAADLDRALLWLAENGLIRSEEAATGGRPAEVWFPCPIPEPAVSDLVGTNEETAPGKGAPDTSFVRQPNAAEPASLDNEDPDLMDDDFLSRPRLDLLDDLAA